MQGRGRTWAFSCQLFSPRSFFFLSSPRPISWCSSRLSCQICPIYSGSGTELNFIQIIHTHPVVLPEKWDIMFSYLARWLWRLFVLLHLSVRWIEKVTFQWSLVEHYSAHWDYCSPKKLYSPHSLQPASRPEELTFFFNVYIFRWHVIYISFFKGEWENVIVSLAFFRRVESRGRMLARENDLPWKYQGRDQAPSSAREITYGSGVSLPKQSPLQHDLLRNRNTYSDCSCPGICFTYT